MGACKRIAAGVLLGASSIYLTWLVDRATLSTWLQRAFIFLYFAAVSVGLLLVRKGRVKKDDRERRFMVSLFSVLGAILCVLYAPFFRDAVLPVEQAGPMWMTAVLLLGIIAIIGFFLSWIGEIVCEIESVQLEENTPIKRSKFWVVFAVSILVVGAIFIQQAGRLPSFLVETRDSAVTFINDGKNPDGKGSEVWLKILKNENEISPERLFTPDEESGWMIRDGYILSVTPGTRLTLPVKTPRDGDMEFLFNSHEWTGRVSIEWEGQVQSYDFYSETGKLEAIQAPWADAIEITYIGSHVVLYSIFGVLTWGLVFWLSVKNHKSGWLLLFGIAWIAVVLDAVYIRQMNNTFALLLGISAGTAFWLWRRPQMLQKYFHIPAQIAVAFLSVYFTFALTGDRLFITGKRMKLTGDTISCFVLLTVVLCPIIYAILGIFEYMIAKAKKMESRCDKKKNFCTGLVFFLLFACIELICSLGFYPASMTSDGMNHWLQGIGYQKLNNAHPLFYALLIRLLSKIAFTPYVCVVFQILFYAFITSKWLLFLYKKGVPFKVLVLFDAFITLLPNNYLTLTLISKNPMFAILNLWILIQLVYLLDDPQKCVRGIGWNVETAIALSSLYLVRYNSFLAVWAVAVVIILITCFYYQFIQWRALPTLAGTLAIILFVQGPLYSNFDITYAVYSTLKNKNGEFQPPLTMVYSSLLINEVEAPEDIKEIMESVLPKKEYYSRHAPYNSDIMAFGKPGPNYGDQTTREGIAIYLRLLSLYPDIVIQERLQGTDLLWNIFQNQAHYTTSWTYAVGTDESFLLNLFPDTDLNRLGLSIHRPNSITNLLCEFSSFIERQPLLDTFIWRNGIYIVLMLVFAFVLVVHHHINYLLLCIPSIASLITLLLVIGWQIYNYIYFFPMAVIAFITCGCVMITKGERRQKDE